MFLRSFNFKIKTSFFYLIQSKKKFFKKMLTIREKKCILIGRY